VDRLNRFILVLAGVAFGVFGVLAVFWGKHGSSAVALVVASAVLLYLGASGISLSRVKIGDNEAVFSSAIAKMLGDASIPEPTRRQLAETVSEEAGNAQEVDPVLALAEEILSEQDQMVMTVLGQLDSNNPQCTFSLAADRALWSILATCGEHLVRIVVTDELSLEQATRLRALVQTDDLTVLVFVPREVDPLVGLRIDEPTSRGSLAARVIADNRWDLGL